MGRRSARKIAAKLQAPPQRKPCPGDIPWSKYLLVGAALFIGALLAYSDSFRSGFVLDNRPLILQDPRISQATSDNVALIWQHSYWWPTAVSSLYRPVTTLSYLFNYSLLGEGDHPGGYHWFNFLLHALNVLLLFVLSLRFLQKFWPSAFIAGLWAVHPVLTESVTNIVGRPDLLAAACLLSGFLFYLKSTDSKGWARFACLAGLATVTFVGVFSKESAVAILGVLALYEFTWWKDRKQVRSLALGCAAIAPAFVALFYLRSMVLAGSQKAELLFVDNPLVGAHFWTTRLTSIAVMARYLWLLVWPARLSCDYSYAVVPLATGNSWNWIEWTAVAVVIAAVATQFTRNKLIFFFAAFAFVTFVPMSNLLFPIGTIMAERFLYLPALGFAVCVVLVIYAIGQRTGSRPVAPAVLCLMIAALGIRTWIRNLDWRDDVTLWRSEVDAAPNSFKGHAALALALFQSDPSHANIDRVIGEAEKSLEILDPLPDAMNADQVYSDSGVYYVIKGGSLAKSAPDGTTTASPQSVQAYERAQQLFKRGTFIEKVYDDRFKEREHALGKSDSEIPPTGSASLYANLAANSVRVGDQKTAFDAAIDSRLLDPSNTNNYHILSTTLLAEGRKDDAAIMLVEGVMFSGTSDPSFLETLRRLYKEGLDPNGCAIVQGVRGETLNNSCGPAHDAICRASMDLTEVYHRKMRPDLAEVTKRNAMNLGCPAAALAFPKVMQLP